MESASFQFILFGLAAAIVSNFSRSPIWRSIVLMAATLIFLGLLVQSPIALLPLAGFLILGYAALQLLERGWTRALPWCLVSVILVYMWLKRYTVLPEAIFLRSPYFTL